MGLRSKRIMEVPLYAAFNLCAPRPIAILTTVHRFGHEREVNAAPMSTLTLQGKRPPRHKGPFEKAGPPVHLVSITPSRKTYRNLLEVGEAVANFIWPRQADVEAMYVLSDGGYQSGNQKIRASGFTLENSRRLSVPRIAQAMAWIEYKLIRMIPIPESERPIILLRPVAAYCLKGLVDSKTFAYCTENVPAGQLSANICSGRLQEILVAKERTGGRALTPPQHWWYSDRKSTQEPFLTDGSEAGCKTVTATQAGQKGDVK